ncbi:hypothetical protein AAC387_Pa05g0183 [Persea americana]
MGLNAFHSLCHLYVTTDNTGRSGSVGRNCQCIDGRVEDLNGVSCSALGLRPLGIGRNNLCTGGRIENWKCPTCSSHVEASTICR